MANDDSDPQDGDPGNGPGQSYVSPEGIIALSAYLAVLAILLLWGVWSWWPSCDSDSGPTITSVKPAAGPEAGGTAVTVNGTGFREDSVVVFGGALAADVKVKSATEIAVKTPPHAPAIVPVELQGDCGASTIWRAEFTYALNTGSNTVAQLSVEPSAGPAAGHTKVTLRGGSFEMGDEVRFDKDAGTGLNFDGATRTLSVDTPSHMMGRVDVTVVRKGSAVAIGTYTYADTNAITLSSIDPTSGSIRGCEAVNLTGSGFADGVRVAFGVVPAAAVKVNSPNSITALTPAHAKGKVDVLVTLGNAARLAGAYSYQCPQPNDRALLVLVLLAGTLGSVLHALRSLFMYVGARKLVSSWALMYVLMPFAGGATAVIYYIIVGAGLVALAGSQPGFTTIGIGALVGLFNAQAIEKLKSVTEGVFSKAPVSSERLTQTPLTLSGMAPTEGLAGGGTDVLISGTGFAAGTVIAFDGVPATSVSVVGDKQIKAKTPAHAVGSVDVTATLGGKLTATLPKAFTYK